jgi:hypothetical protein
MQSVGRSGNYSSSCINPLIHPRHKPNCSVKFWHTLSCL